MSDPLYARPFPASQTIAEDSDLEAAWATVQFYREVSDRQAFEAYCQWYYDLAERNRQDLEQMAGEVNIWGWFCR